jgi:hypothetical protein
MTFQPGANLYTLAFGTRPENIEVPHYDSRAPTATDVNYPIGKEWLWINNAVYKLLGLATVQGITTATWVELAGSSGSIISVLGTANQVTVNTVAGVATISLPSAMITPGSLTTTTSLSATTTVTAGTSITATLGNITATNGNIVRGTAGNKDIYSSVASTTTAGANSAGTVTLVGGTATISTTAVTASSQIRLYRQGIGATGAAALGILTLGTKTAGVSFVINAVQAADATSLQASDVSVIGWEIVN